MADETVKKFAASLDALKVAQQVEKTRRFFAGGELGHSRDAIHGRSVRQGVRRGQDVRRRIACGYRSVAREPVLRGSHGRGHIMDFQARAKSTTPAQRKALFDLYVRRHDRINNWDLVDRAAPHVVGRYLADRPRRVLDKLARSQNPWERRTAIVGTYYFIRAGDVADTFRIAEILVMDSHELVQKATGSWLREAGKKDQDALLRFLKKHAGTMPRTTLRYTTEKLDKGLRARFMNVKTPG